ncbi:Biopolymer transport protein ExbB [Crateriforma conspicua]|uniref:Biopolymer transport protein ExbB n=2 Tax=Crateriforma conspicua TaxID=2527996 RepID=A0A5C5XZS5_9PLAN|nr:MotA/TolQ/ExbB proton channel family protein [Crateriforma conspicua]QDV63609.1 Biopolymer transport protein ExbB [Crateriforma conspicua]TWT68897.1 Biopolymer transport protein ExbB [Crateriforma conspicua]
MTNKGGTRKFVAADDRRGSPAWRGLVSFLLPPMVLAFGLVAWTAWMPVATGQQMRPQSLNFQGGQAGFNGQSNFNNGNTQYYNTAATGPDARIASAPSSIPSLNQELPQTQQDIAPESEDESAAWEMPAIVDKISQGGVLMIPLAICSLVVLALSMERLVSLRRGRVIPRPFVRRFTECVEDGQLSFDEATELCEEFSCPVAEVFQAAVRRWGRPMFEVEQAVMDAGDRVADGLRRFLRVFHAISNVAPLIGLLGTVLGMIEAFETISSQESIGHPELLASGISQALLTTAGGLSVAIPAYLAYMYFSAKSDGYLNEIDKLCQRVVDCISAEGLESAGGGTKSRKRRAA